MSPVDEVKVLEASQDERETVLPVIDESFEGWYLRHARRKLFQSQKVLRALGPDGPEGVAMLDMLDSNTGYVFYIAVRPSSRRRGLGAKLLDESVKNLGTGGAVRIFAAVEDYNDPSRKLFESKGFHKVRMSDVSSIYGRVRAFDLYRRMVVVPGESLLMLDLSNPSP